MAPAGKAAKDKAAGKGKDKGSGKGNIMKRPASQTSLMIVSDGKV